MYATWCYSFRIMTWLCVLSVLIRNYIETWLREISALNCECLMLGLFGVKKSRKRWERGVYQVITRAPKPHGLITLTIAQKGRERERWSGDHCPDFASIFFCRFFLVRPDLCYLPWYARVESCWASFTSFFDPQGLKTNFYSHNLGLNSFKPIIIFKTS